MKGARLNLYLQLQAGWSAARQATSRDDPRQSNGNHRLRTVGDLLTAGPAIGPPIGVGPNPVVLLRVNEDVRRPFERLLDLADVVHVLVVVARQIVFEGFGGHEMPLLMIAMAYR